jgi:putative transposase
MVFDILVQERRNRKAAERFLRRVLDGYAVPPRVIVTDKLASYLPAIAGCCLESTTAATSAEQSGGELASPDPPPRTRRAALHVARPGAAFPLLL